MAERRSEGAGGPAPKLGTRVLVVEDDDAVRFVLVRGLSAVAPQVEQAATLAAARRLVAEEDARGGFACVFTDIRLPDGDGLDLAGELAKRTPRPSVVVMTAQDTVAHAIEAMRRGADEYLVKPFAIADVQQAARAAVERARVLNAPAPAAIDGAASGLVGRSAAMREVYKRIGRAAPTDLPVLLEGESGTGKELVARALHAASGRAHGPFVAVNLAALPANLVESELYGHERGAFTGASAARPGQFELAQGGTLLLDEVGEMPLELQPKLLRALQDGEISRVGGRSSKVDVRVIAATNVDLGRAVATGRFRADLYYRLRVLSVRLPPLRERLDDLPLLVEHVLRRDAPRLRGRPMRLAPDALDVLRGHTFPGNVRELENLLRGAIVEATGDVLKAADVRKALGTGPSRIAGNDEDAEESGGSWEDGLAKLARAELGQGAVHEALLARAEKVIVREALAKAHGNQVKAAGLLGLHRNSLRRRMEELKLAPDGRDRDEE